MELTTVADDEAVVFDGAVARHYADLTPDTDYTFDGLPFRTMPRLGAFLCRFATVNDTHFGETECGLHEGIELGPVFTVEPGAEPYPEVMNRGAIAEMAAIDPAVVVVKGDLTCHGTDDEFQAFFAAYEPVFGDWLHLVRGNHDAVTDNAVGTGAPFAIDLPGVEIAVLDTTIPGRATGRLPADQLEWLDERAARADDRPLLVFGHHHVWSPDAETRPEGYFGVCPDDSERLVELVARRRRVSGYFAGHTHRNRVRRIRATRDVPWVEVACVKDFPGAWAEYRVFEGAILQVFHRISSPQALAWTEKTRGMFGGLYPLYSFGALEDRCFPIRPRNPKLATPVR